MPTWKFSGIGSSVLTFLFSTVSLLPQARAQVAGTVGAVNRDAKGTPPGRASSPLTIGRDVVQKELLQTDADGTAHIIFGDRSALNVGRNSSIVVDSFVYDANAGAGRQAISLTQGALRFVGGQISHSSEATIKTPIASIGIRGGNVTAIHQRNRGDVVMVHNGFAHVRTTAGERNIRTGFQVTIDPLGNFGEITRIDLEALRDATRLLSSIGGQNGGARWLPNDADAARHRIGDPRAPSWTPRYDLPGAGDNLTRGKTSTTNQSNSVPVYRP